MTFELSQDALLKFLTDNELEPSYSEETGQIYVMMHIKKKEIPVFFKLHQEHGLLQLIAYLPIQIHEHAVSDTARFLHLLNKQIEMPGFGMDEKERLMFYRVVIPCLDNQVEPNLLTMHLNVIGMCSENLMHAIALVASGKKSMKEMGDHG